ncbi:Hsp20/alpha crystallin family protein [Crenobacter sp. SG2303]|uniref:Hsp20/alpha crystallin family protein n=1 Tax=Crenobacter oryzisoli TaxID=3056844 RepID=A0ABT7XJ15_9NEIS|nr:MULTISPECIES: Hsp20/alpha crystallin family protein [unclassified Crenobacter]MDN0073730.1 Hsp20/alpha crystallin family protein [Crenobacter sp. SG2303]MDN0082714.1 Hsp20/alpha crystallin family protein [Crenobacter sp. SG2305]
MSHFYFGTDLFNELNRLHQQMPSLFPGTPSSLRSAHLGAFPPVNIGTTDDSIEIVAFAPGIKPDEFDISIDKGLLTISGERKPILSESDTETRPYAQERFVGTFRRAIELPENADPDKVQARYANGCLSISIGKRESSKPRAITVQ